MIKKNLQLRKISLSELLNLEVNRSDHYMVHEFCESTPDEIVSWSKEADTLILEELKKITDLDLEVASRSIMLYLDGNGAYPHVDDMYMEFGELKPYTTLLYMTSFTGGGLQYGDDVISLGIGDLLIFPTEDKITHKVLPYKGARIVYQPFIQVVETNEIVLFAKSLLDQIEHGDREHRIWLRNKIGEVTKKWIGRI